jgi:hypothetical protein
MKITKIRTYNYRGKKLFEVVNSETSAPILIAKDSRSDVTSQEDSGHEAPMTSTNQQRVA